MAAPIQSTPLNGIAGYEEASFVTNDSDTFVTLKKREDGKDYWVTLTFYKPIDEANIRSYLAAKEAKDKIEQMVKQYAVFEGVYGQKQNFRLESTGNQLHLLYKGKKNGAMKRLDMSESEFERTFFLKSDDYQKKIDEANKAKKNDREKKFRDKKKAFVDLKEKFRPLAKILATPAHPAPRPKDPSIRVGAAPQTAGNQAAPAAGQAPAPAQQQAVIPPQALPTPAAPAPAQQQAVIPPQADPAPAVPVKT